jgi:hypothetical protein
VFLLWIPPRNAALDTAILGLKNGRSALAFVSQLNASSDHIDSQNPDRLFFNSTNKGGKQLEGLANAQTRCSWSRETTLAALGGVQRLARVAVMLLFH